MRTYHSDEGRAGDFINRSIIATIRNIVDNPMNNRKNVEKANKNKIGKYTREKSSNWNGGITYDKKGYVQTLLPEHPDSNQRGYVWEHRLVMEKHIGRHLKPEERVHHIDWNVKNNHINNLHLFSCTNTHLAYHRFLRDCVKEIINT